MKQNYSPNNSNMSWCLMWGSSGVWPLDCFNLQLQLGLETEMCARCGHFYATYANVVEAHRLSSCMSAFKLCFVTETLGTYLSVPSSTFLFRNSSWTSYIIITNSIRILWRTSIGLCRSPNCSGEWYENENLAKSLIDGTMQAMETQEVLLSFPNHSFRKAWPLTLPCVVLLVPQPHGLHQPPWSTMLLFTTCRFPLLNVISACLFLHRETLDVLCHLLLSGGNEFFQGVQILLYIGRMTCL